MLSVASEFLMTIVATWLGATAIVRAPRYYVARVFGLTMALAALWGGARLIARLTGSASVAQTFVGVEAALAAVAPAILLHFTLAYCHSGRWEPAQRLWLGLAYTSGCVVALQALLDREHPLAISSPHTLLGLPGPALAWGWIALRGAIFGVTLWWAWRARRRAAERTRRDRQTVLLLALIAATLGITATILARQYGRAEWPGTLLLLAGLCLGAYALAAGHLLRPAAAARRSFAVSLGTGLLAAFYVGGLLALDRLARTLLATDAPLVTALALILTIALFDPVRERFRDLVDRSGDRRALPYRRLIRSLGGEMLAAPQPREAIEPALTQICEAVGIEAAAIYDLAGTVIAAHGTADRLASGSALALPLIAGDQPSGRVLFGPKRNRLPYSEAETDLLRDATAFIAASLQLAEKQTAQATALAALTEERSALEVREAALAAMLEAAPEQLPSGGLHVHALGPLRVVRDGEMIRQWGGAKAGSRQAIAIFAFLFDRGERGVAKDEFLELIWPDVPLDKADLAFHRTLGGLRRTLEPGLARASEGTLITFSHDRYRLAPAAVAWSDLAAFEDFRVSATATADPTSARSGLEEAVALYRGEYLDDCPFYGDSEFPEGRRAHLRERYVDLLLALGERRESANDLPGAATCYRDALRAAQDDCPRADAALARLGLAT